MAVPFVTRILTPNLQVLYQTIKRPMNVHCVQLMQLVPVLAVWIVYVEVIMNITIYAKIYASPPWSTTRLVHKAHSQVTENNLVRGVLLEHFHNILVLPIAHRADRKHRWYLITRPCVSSAIKTVQVMLAKLRMHRGQI